LLQRVHPEFTGILEVMLMKLFNFMAGVGVAVMLGATAPLAWGQATEPSLPSGATAIAPAATSPIVPGEKAAPGAPGSEVSPSDPAAARLTGSSHAEMVNSQYVHMKIEQARAQGKDVSAARMQEQMGNAALKKGNNDRAAQHFDTALRAIGEMPSAPGEDSGGFSPDHQMRGAVD
jgi:hypothetical protein